MYLHCIWRCKRRLGFSAVALQNSIILCVFFPLQILQILKSSSMMSLKMLLSSKISMQFQVVSQKILTKLFPSLLWYTFKNSFLYSRTNLSPEFRTWKLRILIRIFYSFYWRHWVDRRQVFSTIVTMANTHQIFPRCRCVQCPNESLVLKRTERKAIHNVSLAFFHARWPPRKGSNWSFHHQLLCNFETN